MKIDPMSIVMWTGLFVGLAYLRNERKKRLIRDVINTLIKKHPGYTIVACKDIKIEDINRAYRYAFDSGFALPDFDLIFIKLFDTEKCMESIAYTGETSQFAYMLLLFAGAGAIKGGKLKDVDGYVKSLLSLKDEFQKQGYDTSKWTIQNPKAYIEKLVKEY